MNNMQWGIAGFPGRNSNFPADTDGRAALHKSCGDAIQPLHKRPLGTAGEDGDVVVAARLEGKAVRGTAGELLGRVRHVLLDLSAGHIAFFVLELEGTDRRSLCAVPWSAFAPDPAGSGLVLAHTLNDLHRAPSFPADAWPALGDPEWLQAVYRFFALPPHWGAVSR